MQKNQRTLEPSVKRAVTSGATSAEHAGITPGKGSRTSHHLPPAAAMPAIQRKAENAAATGAALGVEEDWTNVVFRPDLHQAPILRQRAASGGDMGPLVDDDPALEREADDMGAKAARGELVAASRHGAAAGHSGAAVQKKDAPEGAPEASEEDEKLRSNAGSRVEKWLSYGAFDWVISDADAEAALAELGALSMANLQAVMAALGQTYKTRLLGNLPDSARQQPAFSKVLVAMGPQAALPHVESLLSYGIFKWAVTDRDAQQVLAIARALTAEQRRELYDKLGPELRLRFMNELPQENLGKRAKATTPERDDSLQEGQSRYSLWDELLVLIGSVPRGVMGAHQLSRVGDFLDALGPGDYEAFRKAIDSTTGVFARAFLFKALAANCSVSDIAWLAGEISGKDLDWLLEHCTLGDTSMSGTGIKQQFSHSCGVTTVQMIRGEYDPVYALRLRQSNAYINDADARDPSKINPPMAAEQKHMTETATGGSVGGHQGKAVSRSQVAKGVGRWVVDWLNDMSSVTGLEYDTVKNPAADDAISTLDSKVGSGMMTPTVIGNGASQFTHYILCMHTGATEDGKRKLQFHDPWDGVTEWKTEDEIRNGIMDIAGSNMITALEVPRRASGT